MLKEGYLGTRLRISNSSTLIKLDSMALGVDHKEMDRRYELSLLCQWLLFPTKRQELICCREYSNYLLDSEEEDRVKNVIWPIVRLQQGIG
jgi:hypothetical protein